MFQHPTATLKTLLAASTLLLLGGCQPSPVPSSTNSGRTSAPATPATSAPSPSVTPATPSATPANPLPVATPTPLSQPLSAQPSATPSTVPSEQPSVAPSVAPVTGETSLGFKPDPHGFAFANGSGGNFDPKNPATAFLTTKAVQKMFGDKNVCTGATSGDKCVPTPAAKKWIEKINKGMNGGQCEGMAVLALTLFMGLDKPAALEDGKANTFALTYSSKVRESIGYYFAYQYTSNVTKGTIKGTPTEVLEKLKPYLQSGQTDPVTLGFYGEQGGHATTPYAIVDKGNGISHILMYDNNWPGQERFIEVDTKANTWIYNFAATNPTEAADAWKGDASTQSLEFTPLSTRLKPATCPYCPPESTETADTRQVFLNAGTSGNAHIKIVDKSDPTKFIGWDPVKKAYVNNMAGASLNYDKSILSKGDTPVAPMIEIPKGLAVDIKIDGKDLGASEQVEVNIFGQGKAMKISNIDLDPKQEDSISLGSDGDSLKYSPGDSPDQESPEFEMAFDNPKGKDYNFKIKSLNAGNGENLGLDLVGGELKVSDDGKEADPYDVEVDRVNDDGAEESFSKDDVSLGAGETDDINFDAWGGQGQGMLIGPDGEETEEPDVDADEAD